MAGIYFHIPFCRQACHYCNFHFSTSLAQKDALQAALLDEVRNRAPLLDGESVETIYFGGGTPSLLERTELGLLLQSVSDHCDVSTDAEVTLEANPDDLTKERATTLRHLGVNRLSLGIQSFHDADLQYMNRVHNSAQAKDALVIASEMFDNVSMDLIFGTPTMTHRSWRKNLLLAIESGVQHISAYALTVEEKTALAHFIKTGKQKGPEETATAEQFEIAMELLSEAGYEHYEISNYARPGFQSRHNNAYWNGTRYIGFGPSAHSFDGQTRSWNVSNNARYIAMMKAGDATEDSETLTSSQRANEFIMTQLRTIRGCDIVRLRQLVSESQLDSTLKEVEALRADGLLDSRNGTIFLTTKGKLLADGVIGRLFVVNE